MKKTTTTEATAPVVYDGRVVFVGVRYNGRTIAAVFLPLTREQIADTKSIPNEPAMDDRRLYDVSLMRELRGCRPGAIYAANIDGTQIRYAKGSLPVAFVHDGLRMLWQGIHNGIKYDAAAKAAANKEAGRNLLREQCAPLRDVYLRSTGGARAQLLAQMVEYITH